MSRRQLEKKNIIKEVSLNSGSKEAVERISENMMYPDWFETSPRSKDLPNRDEMTDEDAERYDEFADQWDETRLRIMIAQKSDDCNTRTNLETAIDYKTSTDCDTKQTAVMLGERVCLGNVYYIHSEIPLTVSHDITSPILPVPPVSHVQFPKRITEQAVHYRGNARSLFEAIGRDGYFQFERIMQLIFDLESLVCDYAENEQLYEQLESLAEEITNWLQINVGVGKFVGKYRITEFAEAILEKVHGYAGRNRVDYSDIRRLAHEVDHLAFRVSTYFGYSFHATKQEMGMEASQKYDGLKDYRNSYFTYGAHFSRKEDTDHYFLYAEDDYEDFDYEEEDFY